MRVLDILGDLPGVGEYAELTGRTVTVSVEGFDCRLLNLDTLITAKRAAGREKDLLNGHHLEAIKKRREQQPGPFDDWG